MLAPEIPGFVVTPAARSDAPAWAEFAALPEMNRLVSAPVTSEADLVAMIERTLSPEPGAPVQFVVREAGTGQMVASVGFHTVSALNRTAEVTFSVRPERWGQGLATAVCTAAVRWAFRHRGWVRVQGTALEENAASQRVLLKSGFEFEGRLRNFRLVRGEPCDYLLYACVPPKAAGPT